MKLAVIVKPILTAVLTVGVVTGAYFGVMARLNSRSEAPSAIEMQPSSIKTSVSPVATPRSLAGTYRCWSYNVSGGSDNCRIAPPLILEASGRYSMSSEKGTFRVAGDVMMLSESKIRGPGHIEDGNKIRFEYDYNGLHHTVTYLRDEESVKPTVGEEAGLPRSNASAAQPVLSSPKTTSAAPKPSSPQTVTKEPESPLAPPPDPAPAPEPDPEPSPYAGLPCDPSIPHYTQRGCIE